MRRVLRKLLTLVVILLVLFGVLVGYLGATTAKPRAAADGWERLGDMPDPRGEVAVAVGARVDDAGLGTPVRLFVIGGLSGLGRTVKTVSTFDPEAGRWASGPDLPEKRHHAAAVGLGGVVYVTGGAKRATNWKPESNLWFLQPVDGTWRAGPAMPEGRMGHQMAAIDGKVFVIGGRGETSNVLIYDPATLNWSTGAQMPGPRDHLAIAVVDSKIYAIGGRDSDLRARVDIYDTGGDAWTEGPALPIPMSAMAAGALDDGIHVVGGEDPRTIGGGVIDRHFHLLPGAPEWQEGPLPILGTHGSAGVVLSGRLVIAGGARRQGGLSPLGWTGLVQAYRAPEGAR